ncbi:hypothetical protein G6F24_015013 [Rhizopus arrhizus]|nr:hypothetical protein G6F24_015013 [Rhizopus arrhizus]
MPDHYASHRTRFDLRGYVMLAFAMVVLSLALDGISGLGTPHALVMLMTVAGLAARVGYWLHAANSSAPWFSLALFRCHADADPAAAAGRPGPGPDERRPDDGARRCGRHGVEEAGGEAGRALRLPPSVDGQHRAGGAGDGQLHPDDAGPAPGVAPAAAGVLRCGQFAAVHRDEHRDPARSRPRVRQFRQQPAVDACWLRSVPTWTATVPPLRCLPRSCAWARSR